MPASAAMILRLSRDLHKRDMALIRNRYLSSDFAFPPAWPKSLSVRHEGHNPIDALPQLTIIGVTGGVACLVPDGSVFNSAQR